MANSTLLIVEDNILQQRILKELCAKFDYDVYAVNSGELALEALKVSKFCAIIMDIGLPNMNGIECAQAIRKMEDKGQDRVPIIAVTAQTDDGIRQKCLDSGMDDYISKPFNSEDLRSILLKWTYRASKPNLKLLKSNWQPPRQTGS